MARSLIPSPQSLKSLAKGVEQFSALLAATLGPNQGTILNAKGAGRPEILVDSGIIARRMVGFPTPGENTGAMIIRDMVQELHNRYQDGAATASVLAQAMVQQAVKMVAAGVNPMLLRHGVERGVRAACLSLDEQMLQTTDQTMLKNLIMTANGDEELSRILGEMFEILGKYGAFMVEEYAAPYLDREYIDGGRWRARPASRQMMPPDGSELVLDNPLILAVDDKLERFSQVQAALQFAAKMPGKPPLLILAREVRDEALTAITMNHTRGILTVGVAISTVAAATEMRDDIEDVAYLTGGVLVSKDAGYAAERFSPKYLGNARQVILGRDALTIVGGKGDRHLLQKRVSDLRGRLGKIDASDDVWQRMRLRIARLTGGMGILKVGAFTFEEREAKKGQARKAMRVLESALETGVVPGGGVAYLNCIPAVLVEQDNCANDDELFGVQLVAKALEAPFLQLVKNQGLVHPPVALAKAQQAGNGYGFHLGTGEITPMMEAGIVDSQGILRRALESAGSAAAMVMTTDMIILNAK